MEVSKGHQHIHCNIFCNEVLLLLTAKSSRKGLIYMNSNRL